MIEFYNKAILTTESSELGQTITKNLFVKFFEIILKNLE